MEEYMKASKLVRVLGVSLLLLALVAGAVHAQDEGKVLHTAVAMVGGDLESVDPGIAQTSREIDIINQMFIGLTFQNEETAGLLPGVATSWDVEETDDGGAVYTFHLMENLPWVHYNADTGAVEEVTDESGNVRYVTASDYVYAWKRSLDPELASAYAYVLSPYVVGGDAFAAGEGSADDVMVEAVDDTTLQVTSPVNVAFAPNIYGLWIARAVPQWSIEEFGPEWQEPENFASYGPFTLKEWAHDESVTIIKNPFWPGIEGVPQPALDEVVFHLLDPAAGFAEYQAGTLHAANPPLEELARVKADATLSAEYSVGTNPCTYYIGFDMAEDPVSNVHLRRALSFAIDKQSIVDNVTQGDQIPAQWFVRPGLTAAPTLETHPDLGVIYSPERAQEELALALEDLGVASAAELPTIILAYNDSAGHAAIMQAVQQMWTDTLGVNVQLSPIESTGYFSGLREEAPMTFRSGWCQDYPDANNFNYEVFGPNAAFNYSGFENEQYTELVEQARIETDEEVRRDLYAQAEEILVVEDAAIAPIYWYTTNQLTKPNVTRSFSITGNENYANWDITS
jgi:oligopeptide transport system substrate-binding protein